MAWKERRGQTGQAWLGLQRFCPARRVEAGTAMRAVDVWARRDGARRGRQGLVG
jgi:hypothetical protein